MRAPVAIVAAFLLNAAPALAQESSAPPGGQDAQLHFERGLSLSDDGNYAAAMVEFRYAYRMTHNPLLLYNIALALQAEGHYVEALEALRDYLQGAGAQVTAARRADVAQAMARLEARVGTLVVSPHVPNFEAHIDGVPYDGDRARAGIRLSVGTHDVSIRSLGYERIEEPVDVVSGVTTRLDETMRAAVSGIALECNVPDAEVTVDGTPAGRTPIRGVISVASGHHRVEVHRVGYVPFAADVEVTGPNTRLSVELGWMDPMPTALASHLRVDVRPVGGRAFVDTHPVDLAGLAAVPPGPHHVVIERNDFRSVEHDVTFEAGHTRRIEAWLLPTPEHARLEQRRAAAGTVAIIAFAIAVGGIVGAYEGLYHLSYLQSTDGWDGFTGAVAVPAILSGLAVGVTSSVRYFQIPRIEHYRPPLGRPRFMLTQQGVGVSWF